MLGTDPRTILKDLLPETIPPPELDDMTLWQIVINILSEPPKRKKRKDINTIDDAVKLLQECRKIMVLTGAGVGVLQPWCEEWSQVGSVQQAGLGAGHCRDCSFHWQEHHLSSQNKISLHIETCKNICCHAKQLQNESSLPVQSFLYPSLQTKGMAFVNKIPVHLLKSQRELEGLGE